MENQVTSGYCCEWLQCILGLLLKATAVIGYYVFFPQVVYQKMKAQIDGWFLSLLHM